MKKILIFVLALLIVLSSAAAVSAADGSEAKLKDLVLPKTWADVNIEEVNGSSRLMAHSYDNSLEFGVDFDTDLDSTKLLGTGLGNVCRYGDSIVEIVIINGEKYHVFVKSNKMDNMSSRQDMLDDADYEFFKFNKLNNCWATAIV